MTTKRPHIWKGDGGKWFCMSRARLGNGMIMGQGSTPKKAYAAWYQQRIMETE